MISGDVSKEQLMDKKRAKGGPDSINWQFMIEYDMI